MAATWSHPYLRPLPHLSCMEMIARFLLRLQGMGPMDSKTSINRCKGRSCKELSRILELSVRMAPIFIMALRETWLGILDQFLNI